MVRTRSMDAVNHVLQSTIDYYFDTYDEEDDTDLLDEYETKSLSSTEIQNPLDEYIENSDSDESNICGLFTISLLKPTRKERSSLPKRRHRNKQIYDDVLVSINDASLIVKLVETRMQQKKYFQTSDHPYPKQINYLELNSKILSYFDVRTNNSRSREHYIFSVPSGPYIYRMDSTSNNAVQLNSKKELVVVFDQRSLTSSSSLMECLHGIIAEVVKWKRHAIIRHYIMRKKVLKRIQDENQGVDVVFVKKACVEKTRGLSTTLHIGAWAKAHKNNKGKICSFITYDTRYFRYGDNEKYDDPPIKSNDWRSNPSIGTERLLNVMTPLIGTISTIVRKNFPSYSLLQDNLIKFNKTNQQTENYIPGNLFTSMAINIDARTRMHIDMSDLLLGWCFVLSFGDFSGGDLAIHQLGFRIPMGNGSLVGFRSSLLFHGNTSMTGFRHSIVFFTCARMIKAMYDDASLSGKEYIDHLINNM